MGYYLVNGGAKRLVWHGKQNQDRPGGVPKFHATGNPSTPALRACAPNGDVDEDNAASGCYFTATHFSTRAPVGFR